MTTASRVFLFALLSGISASILLLLIQTLAGGPWHQVIPQLLTANGILTFAFLLIVAVLPVSLPMTLVGGWIAARVTANRRYRHSVWFWIGRGCMAGFALAALGAVLWYDGTNATYLWNAEWDAPPAGMVGLGQRETLTFVVGMALVAGVAGAVVGGVVGTYCWRLTKGLPPNNALQQTSGAAGMDAARS